MGSLRWAGRADTMDENVKVPYPEDVDQLRKLLEMFDNVDEVLKQRPDNDQRARYILSSNWLRDRGAIAAQRITDASE